MRVLACYGYRDVRDEEWPRSKKIAPGCLRFSVRAVALDGTDRCEYLALPKRKPVLLGRAAAGVVTEPGESGLREGTPIVAWRSLDEEVMGFFSEFAQVNPQKVLVPKETFSFVELSLLPLWGSVWGAIPQAKEKGAACALCGRGSALKAAQELLPCKGWTICEKENAAQLVLVAGAEGADLERAVKLASRGARVTILSSGALSVWENWALALPKTLCFNFGSVLEKSALEEVLRLATEERINLQSLLIAQRSWDDAEKAFDLLESQGDAVVLTQGRAEEPYFP